MFELDSAMTTNLEGQRMLTFFIMAEFYMYILHSNIRDKYYVGSCDDLEKRLTDHNAGRSKYTRTGKPWQLMYHETYSSRSDARRREMQVKKRKSRKYLEYLIKSAG